MRELEKIHVTELDHEESEKICGGQPSRNTGFWYDIAYTVTLMMYTPRPGLLLINPY